MINNNTKAKTRQQIAYEYGICSRTLKRWLAAHEIKLSKGLITPKEQEMIYNLFGIPKNNQNKG